MGKKRLNTVFANVTVAAAILATGLISANRLGTQTGQRLDVSPTNQTVVTEFQKALADYVKIRDTAIASFKPVAKDATPVEIDVNQRLTSRAIANARAQARPGSVFHPAVREYVRRTLADVFKQLDGKGVRASILDENPIGTAVRINGPYPDGIPLATMPPQVLEALPRLPPDLEYRFVGDRLILFDSHAQLIIDYIDAALPKA